MHEKINLNHNRSKVKILEHHVRMIEERYPDIFDPIKAKSVVINDLVPNMEKLKHSDGSKRYPNIKKEKFAENLARLIVAVNTNNYEKIPDYKDIGSMNKDIACDACGNLKETIFTMKCELVTKRKELTLKHYYESLNTSIRFRKNYD